MINDVFKQLIAFITRQTHSEQEQRTGVASEPAEAVDRNLSSTANSTILADWNEESYLRANPDIAALIEKGLIASALDHYIANGYYENRPGVQPGIRAAIAEIFNDDLEFPPEKLRKRVHGDEEVTGFAKIGRTVSFNIYSAINNTVPLGNNQRILDFGCGCGRILRYFHKLSANNTFYGTDIDGEAITWCSNELSSIAKFVQNDIHPPLPFDDETFDFVYSISIFTHLPEEMHLEWLRELKRVTKPGGYLLLTVHGEQLFNDIFGAAFERLSKDFNDKGFCYFEGEKTEGLPDFYQTSFHTKDYLFNKWTEFFEIKQFVAKGIANNQDLVLCRKIAP